MSFLFFFLFLLILLNFSDQLFLLCANDAMVLHRNMMLIVSSFVEEEIGLLVECNILPYFSDIGIIHLVPLCPNLHKRVVMTAVCATTGMHSDSIQLELAMRSMLAVRVHELVEIQHFGVSDHFRYFP